MAKVGLDAVAVAAAMLLVTGVVLLAWGAAALVRATPGWWRLLAVPAAMALLWFVLLPLTLAVNATSRPPGPPGPPAPVSYQDVAFRTADGVRLSAWYIPPRNGAAAVSFLARQPGIQVGQIAVLGESMGGEHALAAAGSDPRIRAVVAEGVTGQQLADHGWLPHGVGGAFQRGMEWVMYSVADEPLAARWFRAASPATVQVWVVPGAGHTQGLATAPRAWEDHVIGFLDAALGR